MVSLDSLLAVKREWLFRTVSKVTKPQPDPKACTTFRGLATVRVATLHNKPFSIMQVITNNAVNHTAAYISVLVNVHFNISVLLNVYLTAATYISVLLNVHFNATTYISVLLNLHFGAVAYVWTFVCFHRLFELTLRGRVNSSWSLVRTMSLYQSILYSNKLRCFISWIISLTSIPKLVVISFIINIILVHKRGKRFDGLSC